MVTVEIDGQQFEAEPGSTIIQVADDHGIYIPRFCYHKKLTVAANCRMCLVEVEKAPKTLPACATPVSDGMKVYTRSQKACDSQKSVMEFLLINHPLDCPVCDQGGQCELQDLAMGYGADLSAYEEKKRAVSHKNIGPLIATEMTRCIHCTRCVRFGEEVAGLRELGLVHRGNGAEIDTYVEHALLSEISGNIIDLCPVGALTSKPFRFQARAWEMTQHDSIAPHDCVGSNIHLNTLRQKVLRVLPRENTALNDIWLSDRDRFSYTALDHEDRLLQPMVKHKGTWQTVDWSTAFDRVVKGLKVVLNENPAYLGALLSPNATTEEAYLLQKLLRGLGCHNIDHRLRAGSTEDQAQSGLYPRMAAPIAELANQQAVFLIGSILRMEQPMLAVRVRQAFLKGAKIYNLNVYDHTFHLRLTENVIVSPADFVHHVAEVLKAACEIKGEAVPALCRDLTVSATSRAIAEGLLAAESGAILLGAYVESHPDAHVLRALAQKLSTVTGASFNPLTSGANSQGCYIAGAVPHHAEMGQAVTSPGLSAKAMFEGDLAGFILLNTEPELDAVYAQQAMKALSQAGFVVSITAFASAGMRQYADVLLPAAAFTETPGTYVNIEGKWQSFMAGNVPPGEARPAWKILRVLGNLLEVKGFDYTTSQEILVSLKERCRGVRPGDLQSVLPEALPAKPAGLQLLMMPPMYATDALVRRAAPLQDLIPKTARQVCMNPETASQCGLAAGDRVKVTFGGQQVKLKLSLDACVPNQTIALGAGLNTTAGFGQAYATVEVEK